MKLIIKTSNSLAAAAISGMPNLFKKKIVKTSFLLQFICKFLFSYIVTFEEFCVSESSCRSWSKKNKKFK